MVFQNKVIGILKWYKTSLRFCIRFWNTNPSNEKTLIDDACSELLFEESDFIESESESADR